MSEYMTAQIYSRRGISGFDNNIEELEQDGWRVCGYSVCVEKALSGNVYNDKTVDYVLMRRTVFSKFISKILRKK